MSCNHNYAHLENPDHQKQIWETNDTRSIMKLTPVSKYCVSSFSSGGAGFELMEDFDMKISFNHFCFHTIIKKKIQKLKYHLKVEF